MSRPDAADVFPTSGDIRRVSATTAAYMHNASSLSISDETLRDVFRRTLADSVGYPADTAHAMATALVSSLSPGVGLMVRPAPDLTSFFHRSVLEFLAAERMLALPGADQIELFCSHLADRRWSQVLGFLARGLVRPQEIQAIVDALDATSVDDPLLREQTDLLAAELVVGASQADAPTRRRLLDRVVREIETGERSSHRAHLIDRLVTGLSRREIRGELEARFAAWLRGSSAQAWSAVLDAASTWEPDDTLLTMLWHALLSDSDEVQRVAGRVLGTRFAGRDDVAERLARLATTTRLPDRRAAATEALVVGWPRHDALDTLVATGVHHPHAAVRHASVAADLLRGNADESNRSALIDLLDHAPILSAWSRGIADLMFAHYPSDETIFEHYVPHANPAVTDQFRFGEVPPLFLILKGYTDRPEARQFFLRYIAADRKDFPTTPSNLTDRVPWHDIAEIYRSDDEVIAAVERLVGEYDSPGFHCRDLYFYSLVARTRRVQDLLLECVGGPDVWGLGWAVKALVNGWPADLEVREALSRLVDPDAREAVPQGALWYLPDIITDPDDALDRLATLASRADDQGAVVSALGRIVERGGLRHDPRTETIINSALGHSMTGRWTSPEAELYAAFPEHPRVRALALDRLDVRDAPLDTIARGFRDDREVCQHIADRFRALDPALRGRLVEGVAERPPTDPGASTLLDSYDLEPDPTVKLLTATAFAERLRSTSALTDDTIDLFTEQARAVGPDLNERRAAAFGALARIGRLDRITNLTERFEEARALQIHRSYFDDGTLFFRVVCRHWDDVKMALGAHFPRRFGYVGGGDGEFWQNVLAVAHDYPATSADLAMVLGTRPELARSAAGVAYLSRVEPSSERLRNATVDLLRGAHARAYVDIQPAWTALHVLIEQFADDPRTVAWLDAELENVEQSRTVVDGRTHLHLPSFGTVAALARLRPTAPAVRDILTPTERVDGEPWHSFPAWTELAAATVPDADGFVNLAAEVCRIVRLNGLSAEYIHRPLTARLRRDAPLAAAVAAQVPGLPGSVAGVGVRLLALSGRMDGALVDHLRGRLASAPEASPNTFDPITAQVRHIDLLVLDVLDATDG